MILYIDMHNHEFELRGDAFIINVEGPEYASCKEILLNTKIFASVTRLSRNLIVLETEKENNSVYIALDEKSIKPAAECEKIIFNGPEKSIIFKLRENEVIAKKAVLALAQT